MEKLAIIMVFFALLVIAGIIIGMKK